MKFDIRSVSSGFLFIVFALVFLAATRHLEIGSAFQMGPGFFPGLVSILLMLFGVAMILKGFTSPATEPQPFPLRGFVLVLAAPIAFALTVEGLGIVPATFILALLSTFASKDSSLAGALATATIVALICFLVFSIGLGIPAPWFGPWLTF